MKLRQVNRPASQATWIEYFYNGELKVVNGEVETDNENWIIQLLQRGYKDMAEIAAVETEGERRKTLASFDNVAELPPHVVDRMVENRLQKE